MLTRKVISLAPLHLRKPNACVIKGDEVEPMILPSLWAAYPYEVSEDEVEPHD
jgi:hypothetical protein